MRKIPCVFERDFSERPPVLKSTAAPGCEWVLAGEGDPTAKWDGTAVLLRDGKLYARYDAKRGKTPPVGFEPCDPEPDPVTGHWPGWIRVLNQPQYRWQHEALNFHVSRFDNLVDGTYEAVGPKINSNKHRFDHHRLIRHGHVHPMLAPYLGGSSPRTRDSIGALLMGLDVEGIVYHHPDGRMAKIRRADYGMSWPI